MTSIRSCTQTSLEHVKRFMMGSKPGIRQKVPVGSRDHLARVLLSGFLIPYFGLSSITVELACTHTDQTPSAGKSIKEIESWLPDSKVTFDHFAFRTYGLPGLGISSLANWFIDLGYKQRDLLEFETKKLRAHWYSPPEPDLPRIFISELKVELMSETAQLIIKKYTSDFDEVLCCFGAPTGLLGATPWPVPTEVDYKALAAESEYAAWVLVNGYNLNHTTISIHRLLGLDGGINAVNMRLKDCGFVLNSKGGEIKVSEDGLLLQSSTVADLRDFMFDGNSSSTLVPGSYIEFAERKILPGCEDLKVHS